MKYIDITKKKYDALIKILKDKVAEFGKLKFAHANQSLKDTSQLAKIKKDIAQIRTALSASNKLTK